MTEILPWIATVATVLAASMTAANLGSRITGLGFCVFLVGSLLWLTNGLLTHQAALTWTNGVLTILNVFGIWRWLGRQTKVEEGADKAAAASEQEPGETLFPISLLSKARVRVGDRDSGTCVDAMAGRASGRVRYVVVSQGGVAGVGETLKRLNWDQAKITDGTVVATITEDEFDRLDTLQRDQWPAR